MSWRYDRTSNSKRKHLLLLAIIPLVAVTAAGFLWLKRTPAKSALGAAPKISTPSQSAANQTVTAHYLINGTVVWARAVEQQANGDYNQPFSQLDTFNRSQYDAWSTDFECPITNNVVPWAAQVNNLVFNCRPEFLPFATKYFSIFDLANNHTDNQDGETGLAETRQHLKDAGVQYFGTFDPADAANVCEILAFPVHVQKSDKSEEKATLPIAFCGWHYFNRPDVRPGELEVMDKYAAIMPVFAFAEMGAEYHAQALPNQVEIAHSIVDRGPEFLIANNPHWVQNTEVYKGKLIVYSMGNFIFDQLDAETQRGASIDTTLSVQYDDNVAKWLALGPSCAAFHDDCLAQAEKQGLHKVKLNLKYDVVAGNSGYKQVTHKADAATEQAVKDRMNWAQTLQQLGQQ